MKNSTLLHYFTTLSLLVPLNYYGQVGINTQTPEGVLDVVSTNSAVILSRNTDPIINVGANAREGMILYDQTNKTIRYYDGTIWNTILYTENIQTNEGVVKLNSGSGIKPSFVFTTSGTFKTNTFYPIKYTSAILLSDFAAPTSNWPENILNPTGADFYITDISSRGRFLENPVNGQVHMWRIIVAYSGKNNGSVAYVTIRLSNPDSTFSVDQTTVAPNGLTSGNLVFYLVTVADSLSIGKGYVIELTSDTPLTATVDSVTRISTNKD